ncbi:hypothetical protein WDW86_05065 [Bdellovibrionota bacterium FG-2]
MSKNMFIIGTFALFSISACTNRAPSLRMLDSRAEYEGAAEVQIPSMREAGIGDFKNSPVPIRTKPKVAAVWVHPHETASRDYFWGGWMSILVEPDQWMLTKPKTMPEAPAILNTKTGKPPHPPTLDEEPMLPRSTRAKERSGRGLK